MDAVTGIVSVMALIVCSIVGYRIAEGLFPAPQRAPRTDFEVLTDAVDEELQRLHSELSTFSGTGDGYMAIVNEIGRLNKKFVELYNETKPSNESI